MICDDIITVSDRWSAWFDGFRVYSKCQPVDAIPTHISVDIRH